MEAVEIDSQAVMERLNARRPDFLRMFDAKIVAIDPAAGQLTFECEVGHEFCHSVDVIQGGFVTALLDAASSHAAMAMDPDVRSISSLEINVNFLAPSRAGRFTVIGEITRLGGSIGFLAARLFNEAGECTATATQTAKLLRRSARKPK